MFRPLDLILNYLDLQSFDYERTWKRLIQKRVMDTNKSVDIKISAHGAFLEWPSSGTLKIEKLENQII